MAVITKSSIEELKSRINILDVVSPVVGLKKAGSQYRGLSPFNPEKTPSFFVSPDKGLFKCFSSGMSGDIFTFVMETERLAFYEAAETLAQRFGIELEYEKGGPDLRERSLRQTLFDIHEIAAAFFHEYFMSDHEDARFVRRYWEEERSFGKDLAEAFRIGLAPGDGSGLRERLPEKTFSAEALGKSGLFYERGGTFFPRFRNRLMIPIRDHQGRIVAFTARQLEITPKDDPTSEAKYVNSPETPIFNKSHLLFGLERARLDAGDDAPFVLVEGQLDVIRCHEKGITTAVAPQGTAVTETQLALLKRYSRRMDCLLDSDNAGRKAALRVLPLAVAAGLETRFLSLPEGSDPDTFLLEHGKNGLERLRAEAREGIVFASEALLPEPERASPERKTQVLEQLFEIVCRSESEVARSEYLRQVARVCRVGEAAVQQDFERYLRRRRRRAPAPGREPAAPAPRQNAKLSGAAETLLAICFHDEHLGKPIAETVDPEWLAETGSLEDRILNRILAEFEHDHWHGIGQLSDDTLLETEEEKRLASSILFEKPYSDDPEKLANQAIRALHINHLNRKIKEIELEIANKSGTVDDGMVFLQRKISEYKRRRLNPPRIDII